MLYCSHCGNQNDDNAFRCVSCGEMLQRVDGPDLAFQGSAEAPTHLVWSILVTIFCCQLTGIPAIVFSAIAMNQNSSGDYAAARRSAKTAAIWCWVSFGLGMLFILPYLFFIGIAAFSGAMP